MIRRFDTPQPSTFPIQITMDKSGANTAAMDEINTRGETQISVRQVKYLNNIVEQDQRAVKRVTRVKMWQVQTPWGRINK